MPSPFPAPVPLKFKDDEKDTILHHLEDLYNGQIEDRTSFQSDHESYDDMFRGNVADREGPWANAANLHVPLIYWLVDAICVRLDSTIWGQTPLVGGQAEEDDDSEAFRHSTKLIDWHLQPKRMNARAIWSRLSRSRGIHGYSVGLLSYVNDKYIVRDYENSALPAFEFNLDDTLKVDEEGNAVEAVPEKVNLVEKSRYHGPVIEMKTWDDVVCPMDTGINLQPRSLSNPSGAPWVMLRSWEDLNLIWDKREKAYTFIEGSDKDTKDEWRSDQPAQDRSQSESGTTNQTSARSHDRHEGRDRNSRGTTRGSNANPEYEIITAFAPWEIEGPDGDETQEIVFFWCRRPRMLLGAFRLSDIVNTGERPLLEMHYQVVGTRWYSMGIAEIGKHLSAELDTLHNMRLDVGFATNMPFFFYRATSGINPEQIELKPLSGIPVDDPNDIRFPQLQSVTSFYYQEEQQLFTIIERVMGVTDLFLGISPTQGAAARHATGFVGTQQEALARMETLVSQDSEAFAFLCKMIQTMEIQYGPDYRLLRLQGKEGPLTQKLSREDLRMRGEYDYRVGSNQGTYSSMTRQEQAQSLEAMAQWNPLITQDMGRLWEMSMFSANARNIPTPERFFGPKEAVGPGVAKPQDEENGEMDQQIHGIGKPGPVHPNDNDDSHMVESLEHIQSSEFQSMGSPNLKGHMAHYQAHVQAKQQKMQQQQQMQLQQQQGGQDPNNAGPTPTNPAGSQDRIVPQLMGVDQGGKMGDISQSLPPNGSPNIGPV
jgi:hypothetical protein